MKATMYVLIGMVVGLAGCAAPQPYVMSQAEYSMYADKWLFTTECMSQGHMSIELAAEGRRNIGYALNRRNYSEMAFQKAIEDRRPMLKYMSRDRCNDLALENASTIQQRDANFKANALDKPSTPTYTTCNRMGTMTYCNSY